MKPLTNAQRTLVEDHLWLVGCITNTMHARLPGSVERDDVEQAGRMGLIEAAQRFVEGRSASFPTYARWRINGAIQDYLRSLDAASKEHRKQITAGEANEIVAIRIEDMYRQPLVESLSPEDASIAAQISAQISTLIDSLAGRQREIVREYYFHDRTMTQIGAGFGVKEARISQVHRKAIETLREQPEFVTRKAVFRFAMNSGLLSALVCLLLATTGVQAQTRVTPSSLTGTPGPSPRVWVVLADGKLAEADLENIQLVIAADGKPILRATQAAQPTVVKTKHVLTAPRTDYVLTGVLDSVHRNGLLQAEGDDYSIVTDKGVTTLRFNPNAVPQAKDIVQIREVR